MRTIRTLIYLTATTAGTAALAAGYGRRDPLFIATIASAAIGLILDLIPRKENDQ